jgi:hypothetical protein
MGCAGSVCRPKPRSLQSLPLGATLAGLLLLGLGGAARAQTEPLLEPAIAPVPASLTLENTYEFLQTFPTQGQADDIFLQNIDQATLLSDQQVSDVAMSGPSFWYNSDHLPERLGGRRLITSWTAFELSQAPLAVVDVVIDIQYWRVLNYLEKYGVLNHLGTSAKTYGYNLRIYRGSLFNRQLLGLYVCNFPASPSQMPLYTSTDTQIPCRASLDLTSIDGFRGTSNSLLGN